MSLARLVVCLALLLPAVAHAEDKPAAEEAAELRGYLSLGADDPEVPSLVRRAAFLEALSIHREAERAAAIARAMSEANARRAAQPIAKPAVNVDVRVRVELSPPSPSPTGARKGELGPKRRRGLIIGLAVGGAALGALVVGLAVGLTAQPTDRVYTPSTLGTHFATP